MLKRHSLLIALFISALTLPAVARASGLMELGQHACTQYGQKTYGTTIDWADSPSDAANRAKKEEKLVFVLHVSGHFEEPGFT